MKNLFISTVVCFVLLISVKIGYSECEGDINCSGGVDGSDLAMLAASYGTTGCGTCDDVNDKIDRMMDAICAIYDQTAVTPRPDFCPEPSPCPCWPDATVAQMAAEISLAPDGVCTVDHPFLGYASAIGNYTTTGEPTIQAYDNVAGNYGCKALGVSFGDTSSFLGGWMLNLTPDEAHQCYIDVQSVCGELGWPPP